eukprot:NODE_3293_length_916_cov_55.788340_g3272_i0.p1 GENE.NODE_3293_length_916_cov_55.788340_g3272_i0~~NODE_3293_length_916_cov_55.788340_g3272_i0.p1  ORF type:complete len:270 (+),score=57.34 NODE_3293_length_916_cov_55.788340_g3272_i0:53-811(+)
MGEPPHVKPPKLDWPGKEYFKTNDWRAIRRGRQVYTEVFAPCHPIAGVEFHWFDLFMTRDEIKELAKDTMRQADEPDKNGNAFDVVAQPYDCVPMPYRTDEAAKEANNGAVPPDLRHIMRAREAPGCACDYVFALMLGYEEEPCTGLKLADGQFFNPYMDNGIISMPPPIADNQVEFQDGTPATQAQIAKDVCLFLEWLACPLRDRLVGSYYRAMIVELYVFGALAYWYRRTVSQGCTKGTVRWVSRLLVRR